MEKIMIISKKKWGHKVSDCESFIAYREDFMPIFQFAFEMILPLCALQWQTG